MRFVVILCLLSSCSSSFRNARFIDRSFGKAPAWLCIPDEDKTNPGGIQCKDIRTFNFRHTIVCGEPQQEGTNEL